MNMAPPRYEHRARLQPSRRRVSRAGRRGAADRAARPRVRAEADRHRARSGPRRDHDARRVLRRARRQPAGRDGARRRRHDGPHLGHRQDAGHQSQLDRVRADQSDRQADRALADGRALQRHRLGRRLARSRRAAHRGGDAVDGLHSRAHQERPRRHFPHHDRARADHHLRRRALVRPLRAPLSVEAARLRALFARPAAVQRHHARPHRPARHLPDGDFRRQPQGDLPERRARRLVRAGLPMRRFRLLP